MPTSPRRHIESTGLHTSGARSVTPKAPRCTLRQDVHQRILELANNFSAQAIVETLLAEGLPAPHRNTIYKEIARHAPPADVWTLADEAFSPAEARAVFDELRYVYSASGGNVENVSKREAWWIARLKATFSDLKPGVAYAIAARSVWDENAGRAVGLQVEFGDYDVVFRPGHGAGTPWGYTLSYRTPIVANEPPAGEPE